MSAPRRYNIAISQTIATFSKRAIRTRVSRFALLNLHTPLPTKRLVHFRQTPKPIGDQRRTMPAATINEHTRALLINSVPGSGVDSSDSAATISARLYPDVKYTEEEKKEIDEWVNNLGPNPDLSKLNTHLSTRTTILGSKPSVADVAAYAQLAPVVKKWSSDERTGEKGYHHIVRHIDCVQNAAVFHLGIDPSDKVTIDPTDIKFVIPPIDAKAEKARKKKENETATAGGSAEGGAKPSKKETIKDKVEAAAGAVAAAIPGTGERKKKEKKEKPAKQPAAAPKEKPLTPALIDLRVGHILKAEQHPNADSLYVSTIAMGDAPGTDNTSEYEGKVVRTVCSGLNGLVPLEEMQGRKIVAVCNLKPVTMRGIKSSAMVLAASPRPKEGGDDGHKGPVELVSPPDGAEAGQRIYFEGWEGEPEPVLNPKKKIWETIQPGFTTTDDLQVGFDVDAVAQLKESGKSGVGKLRTKDGLCSVKTLKGATVR